VLRSSYVLTRPVVNEYLVRERDRQRLRDLLAVSAAVATVAGAALAYTWVRQEILATGYAIEALETELQVLAQDKRELELEAAQLSALPVIAARAAEELGMARPEPLQLLVLDSEPPTP
jgi:cell division protein FtsB